jgi:SPX domain protein involved in polyphosphate accumulation
MKFGQQFEFHKIPEWYDQYLDYRKLKALINKGKVANKLHGLYFMAKDLRSFRLDAAVLGISKSQSNAVLSQTSAEFLIADIKSMQADTQKEGEVIEENDKSQRSGAPPHVKLCEKDYQDI